MHLPSFITNFINFIAGKFSAFIHASALAAKNLNLTDELVNAAHDAVIAAETTGGTGSEKFNAAVAAVQKDIIGIALGAAQTAVQTAWAASLSTPAPAVQPAS